MKYADAVKKFDPVIGLETHVELSTTTKLFCPAEVSFGGDPNSQLTPVSLGLPGSLPVVNKTAVDYAIKLGLALHCEIAEWSQFARKNYFCLLYTSDAADDLLGGGVGGCGITKQQKKRSVDHRRRPC